jgi:hypothetical protein
MLGYYKRHVLGLAERLQALNRDSTNLDRLIDLQREILSRLLITEAKITGYKLRAAQLNARLRRERLPKKDALRVKKAIERLRRRIKDCNWLLYVWRCFGDGIAFSYVDKWAMKSLLYDVTAAAEKERAGHITGKEGFYQEMTLILEAKKHGVPAVLADLTNTIRHGDICLLGASDPYVLEVKTSRNQNERVARQVESIRRIHDYFAKDEAENFRGAPLVRRVAVPSEEVNYLDQLNELIDAALRNGVSVATPEPGTRYVAASHKFDPSALFAGIEYPIVFMLNEAKNEQAWGSFLPFTLSIRKPEALYAFLNGDIYLIVVFDGATLRQIHAERGLALTFLGEDDWAYSLKWNVDGEVDAREVKISRPFMTRVALEFMSWKWIVTVEERNLAEYGRQVP